MDCIVFVVFFLLLQMVIADQFGWNNVFQPLQSNLNTNRADPEFSSRQIQLQQFRRPQPNNLPFPTFGYPPPQTSFSCSNAPEAGFYADVETRCQVIRRCTPDNFMFSFLCPNGTIFDQASQSCDYWYKVQCSMDFMNDVVFGLKKRLTWNNEGTNLAADDPQSITTVMNWVGIGAGVGNENQRAEADMFTVINPSTSQSTVLSISDMNNGVKKDNAVPVPPTSSSTGWIPLMSFSV